MRRIIKYILILSVGLILSHCSNKDETKNLLSYTILKNEVYDIPVKTEVAIYALITDTVITEQRVRDLLTSLYNEAIERTGFKYHTNPTNVYIYAYATKEKSESGGDQWIGMISKNFDDTQPQTDISERQLKSLTIKPVDKFGLSEKLRLEIYKKEFIIEDEAQKEADRKYPIDKAGITMEDIKKNRTFGDNLIEKYKEGLCLEYGVTIGIIDSIIVEGLTKGWANPKY